MGPAIQIVGFLFIASLSAANGNFDSIINRLYAKATDNKPLLVLLDKNRESLRGSQGQSSFNKNGLDMIFRSGDANEDDDDQGRSGYEDRNDDQDHHYRNQNRQRQNRYRNQRFSSKNRRPQNDLLAYFNGGKGRSNGYNNDNQLGNIISSGLSKHRQNRARYSHHHRDHHRNDNQNNDQYESQEAVNQYRSTGNRQRGHNRYQNSLDNSDEQNQYDSQDADQNQNRQSRVYRNGGNNRYQSALDDNHNQNRQRQTRNRGQLNSDRSQNHRNRLNQKRFRDNNERDDDRQDNYWRGNRDDRPNRQYRNDQRNRYDQRQQDMYDQRDNADKYYRYKSKGIARQADAVSQSPVLKTLLRISSDINCKALKVCKDDCGEQKDDCSEKCETKYECDDDSNKEEEEDEHLQSCHHNECSDSTEDENITTRGVLVEPEENPCKRC